MLTQFLYNIYRNVEHGVYPAPWSEYDNVVKMIDAGRYDEALTLLSAISVPKQVELEFVWQWLSARLHIILDSLARAEDHLARAAELSLDLGEEASLFWKLLAAIVRSSQMRESEEMSLALQAERHAASLGWDLYRSLALTHIAGIMMDRGDTAGAVASYLACLDSLESEGKPKQKFGVKYNLGLALFKARQFRASEDVFRELLNALTSDDSTSLRAGMLHQIAVIAKEEERYVDSIELYTQAMQYVDGEERPNDLLSLRVGIADLAVRINDLDRVREMIAPYEEGLPEEILPVRLIELASVRMRLLATEGDYNAAYEQFRIAHDLIDKHERSEELRFLLDDARLAFKDGDYRLPILEESVVVLKQTMALMNQSASKMVEMRAQHERDLADREVKQQRERTKVIVETQDQVQRAIGRDLHDSVGQDLTLLQRMTQRLLRSANDLPLEMRQMLEDMSTSAERAAGDVRRISHLLAAADVSSGSLSASVAELVRLTQQAMDTAVVEYQFIGEVVAAPDGVSRAIYRAVQSLLQNVMRHSEASRVDVQLFADEHELRCTIEDNGRGFDPAIVTRGLGMREVTARMESVGGKVDFDSRPGHGTFVSLSVIFRQQE